MRLKLPALTLLAVVWMGCTPSGGESVVLKAGVPVPEDQGPVLARVGELGGVTAEEFAREAARRPAEPGAELSLDERKELLDQMISDEALFQEAAGRGLLRDRRIRRSVIGLLIKEEVTRQVESEIFTNEELRAYFDTHREDFIIPENIQVMRIFLGVGDERSEAEARALADQLRAQLLTQPDSFRDLAMEHSEDPYARRGGDLGYMTPAGKPGIDPDVVQKAFSLDVGDVSEPFLAGGGYNILHIPKRRDRIERTFEQMKGSVLRKLKNERHQELSEAYVREVRERYAVSLDEAALADVEVERTSVGLPRRGPGSPLGADLPADDEDDDPR